MVHTGPSRGCLKCRQRHVKCDMSRPSCGQCVRLKFECPGYRHLVDVVLRDQTVAIATRYKKKAATSPRRKPKPATDHELDLPRQLVTGLENYALYFLFSDVVQRPTRDWGTSHGHFDFLIYLYTNTSCDSALAAVTAWLGVCLLGTNIRGQPLPQENSLLSKAIKRLSAALSDPLLCLNDETLAAVIMLQQGNHFRDLRYKHRMPSRIHQHGAEALVLKRGLLNFKDVVSKTLYAAVRYNAVDFALTTGEKGLDWAVWDQGLPCLEEDESVSSKPAMQLDAYALSLLAVMKEIESTDWIIDHTLLISMQARLVKLLDNFSSWDQNIPIRWTPCILSRFAHYHATEDTAYIFSQRYLLELGTRLCLLRLGMFKYVLNDDCHHVGDIDSIIEVADKIIASENSFVGRDDRVPLEESRASASRATVQVDSFPHVTVDQCRATGMGSRFLILTLDPLHCVLSKTCAQLHSSQPMVAELRDRIEWIDRERQTISVAYPTKRVQ